jgi:hypothetical protein
MTRALRFTQAAVARAVEAGRKAGLRVSGFTVHPDGSITVHDGEKEIDAASIVGPDSQGKVTVSSWDDV